MVNLENCRNAVRNRRRRQVKGNRSVSGKKDTIRSRQTANYIVDLYNFSANWRQSHDAPPPDTVTAADNVISMCYVYIITFFWALTVLHNL